MAAPSLILSRP